MIGHYCPYGSKAPIVCPPGTNTTVFGLSNSSSCEPCSAGYYCPKSGTTYATLICPVGYYCPSGTSFLGSQTICPTGAFCQEGSGSFQLCPDGTYQDEKGSGSCKLCPAGYLCNSNTTYYSTICPLGEYCPTGSSVGILCANGTYGISSRLTSQSECTPCPAEQ
jgi:hypothetical protein